VSKGDWKLKNVLRSPLLAPFLFAVQPVAFLYSRNYGQVAFTAVLKPLVAILLATSLVLALCCVFLKSTLRASLVVSVLLLTFFSYGRAVDALLLLLRTQARVGLAFCPLWLASGALAVVLIVRTKRSLNKVAQFLLIAAITLSLAPVLRIASQHFGPAAATSGAWDRYLAKWCGSNALARPDKPLPDIYYIILDGYSRSDVLSKTYHYDNRWFLERLERLGFYVATASESNYRCTLLSIPSSLNFGYLDALASEAAAGAPSKSLGIHMLAKPRSVRLLRDVGYRVVFVPSGYAGTDLAQADVVWKNPAAVSGEFTVVLLRTTILRFMLPTVRGMSARQSMVSKIDYLGRVHELSGPKFVFAHILASHHPFYFKADGSAPDRLLRASETVALPRREFGELYSGALEYLNKHVLVVVESILAKSKTPPIIVIQGDHGALWSSPILNAYYMPGGHDRLLYPSISPVNSFRLIFNAYFGTQFKLLPDLAYTHREDKDGELTILDSLDREPRQ